MLQLGYPLELSFPASGSAKTPIVGVPSRANGVRPDRGGRVRPAFLAKVRPGGTLIRRSPSLEGLFLETGGTVSVSNFEPAMRDSDPLIDLNADS